MVERNVFDHVAIAVHRWADGYPTLVTELGGGWVRGGVTETFSPGQIAFTDGMMVELLEPGPSGRDFVSRFITGRGPAAHHLTFKVPDLESFMEGCADLGLALLPAHLDLPGRKEAFVHPKASGMGTLLQAIESEERYDSTTPPPGDLPPVAGLRHRVVWVALIVPDLRDALALFEGVLDGSVVSRGGSNGGWWALIEWNPGRRLLLLDPLAGASLGREPAMPGVDHVLFAPPSFPLPAIDAISDATPVPGSESLGVPVLQIG